MAKKIIIASLLVVLALSMIVPLSAFAQEGDRELESLYEQIHQLRIKIVERQVELGYLTGEEGDVIIKRIQERYKLKLECGLVGGPGELGRFGKGGPGSGFGHCWR